MVQNENTDILGTHFNVKLYVYTVYTIVVLSLIGCGFNICKMKLIKAIFTSRLYVLLIRVLVRL